MSKREKGPKQTPEERQIENTQPQTLKLVQYQKQSLSG